MSAPIILLFKSLVAGYHRKDGTYVKPHNRKGSAAAHAAPGQLALFPSPAAPAKPNPFKGKDPVASTGDMFGEKPAAPAALEAVTVAKRRRVRGDPLDGTHTELTLSNGKVARIQRMSNGSTMGLGGWHDLDADKHTYLADTEDEAVKEILLRHAAAGASAQPEPRVLLTKPAKGDVTDTPEFKRWFGNSKVVDKDGKPLVVYHGTDKKFTEFSKEKIGSNTGWDNSRLGFFFIADRGLASNFAKETSGGGEIVEAYLSIQKPLDMTQEGIFSNREQAPTLSEIFFGDRISDPDEALEAINDEIDIGNFSEVFEAFVDEGNREILARDGYDGMVSNFGAGNIEYIAFNPEQIKSASGNSGAFDPNSPDMTK